MSLETKNWFKFYKDDQVLNIIVINAHVVRICYGDIKERSISDAVIAHPIDTQVLVKGKTLQLGKFSIQVTDELLLKIVTPEGSTILEDLSIKFNCKAEDYEIQEQEYEVINRDLNKFFAYEVKRVLNKEYGFYGLGEKYGFINYLGRTTENWNTDVLGVSPIHTSAQQAYHTSIPFYLGLNEQAAYGVFYDTSYYNFFDFGKYDNAVTVRAEGGLLDYYFIYGPKVEDVIKGYTFLTGTCPLPRKDFLGYQQCRWSYMSSEEVLKIARTFRERGIPLDVIYLDIDYMENYKVFTWNSKKFKDFKRMIAVLKSMNIKLVVIIDPGIKQEIGYHAYDEGIEKDCFIKDQNGEVYIGRVWPGDSAFPDFLRSSVRAWWADLHRELIEEGVSGIWNDMNEIADMSTTTKTVPETTYHCLDNGEIVFQKEAHNLYGHYQAKASYEAMKKLSQDARPFVLTRAASVGTWRYSALWTGDNTSIWEHLEMSIPMLMNLGLSGFSYTGSDIGGFVGDGESELLERWMQLGVFYPLCRNHSCMNSLMQEPWAFGPSTEEIVTSAIKFRYTWISQLYNLFWQNATKGSPIIRPLFYHFQEDANTHNINDQFMFGEYILVAPITRPKTYTRMVYLPKGQWYDFYTDILYTGEKFIIVGAPRDRIPIFIKAGALILRDREAQYIDKSIETVEVHAYLGCDNHETFYFDDGLSFEFETGKFALVEAHLVGEYIKVNNIKEDFQAPNFVIIKHGMKR